MSLLQNALAYHQRGWCVIPVNGKKASRKWASYQQRLPTEADLRGWFSTKGASGLAVVLGPVSGSLYRRDFDAPGAYERWAANQPELAVTLPTARTGRGWHVYFRSAVPLRTKKQADGELRGEGGYVLLPPSVHPSGHVYEWVVPLPSGDVPTVDAAKAGLVSDWTESTEHTEDNRSGMLALSSLSSLCSLSNGSREGLEKAIAEVVGLALPRDTHQSHAAVFKLARGVKAIEKQLGRVLSDQELSAVFGRWYQAAKRYTRPEASRDEYWFEFLEGYSNVKYPLGEGVLKTAWETAQKSPLPKGAMQFECGQIRLLVALCRELQRASGSKPFYLSCRMVQTLLRHDSHSTAAFWLRGLVRSKIVKPVEKGGPETNKATRYCYLHPLDDDLASVAQNGASGVNCEPKTGLL